MIIIHNILHRSVRWDYSAYVGEFIIILWGLAARNGALPLSTVTIWSLNWLCVKKILTRIPTSSRGVWLPGHNKQTASHAEEAQFKHKQPWPNRMVACQILRSVFVLRWSCLISLFSFFPSCSAGKTREDGRCRLPGGGPVWWVFMEAKREYFRGVITDITRVRVVGMSPNDRQEASRRPRISIIQCPLEYIENKSKGKSGSQNLMPYP